MARCLTLRHQSHSELDLHSNSVWDAAHAAGNRGHPDRLGHNHLVGRRNLAALSLGSGGAGALFCLGLIGDDLADFDHLDELGEMINKHKGANVLKHGSGLWLNVFRSLHPSTTTRVDNGVVLTMMITLRTVGTARTRIEEATAGH